MGTKHWQNDPFVSMVVHAFLGALAGMIGGAILASLLLVVSAATFGVAENSEEFRQGIVPILSMGAGSAIGGLLGGIVGMRKVK